MADRLFGTDGVRGVAGTFPLDEPTVSRIGAALVRALGASARPQLLVGRDTRESSVWLEAALARGVHAAGADLTSAGVLPTPAVAFLTARSGFAAGVVISASHNPYRDNGIKVFSPHGTKLPDEVERRIEGLMAETAAAAATAGVATPAADLVRAYLDHVKTALRHPEALASLPVAIDCAHGATVTVAPRALNELGLAVTVMGDAPNGRNINLDCGSTHPGALADLVRGRRQALGIAFDGDGDRAILVDHTGRVVDGDAIMYICARHLHERGRLRHNAIVATVMSNVGLELALKPFGIDVVRCAVGDKYVMEQIARRELALGGEQSGHVIFPDYQPTGDGLLTALCVLDVMAETGRTLAELAAGLTTYPQVLVNVPVGRRHPVEQVPAIAAAMAYVEAQLSDRGRLLVRYSGTEPLLRIMIEGEDERQIRTWAEQIADEARRSLA